MIVSEQSINAQVWVHQGIYATMLLCVQKIRSDLSQKLLQVAVAISTQQIYVNDDKTQWH
eukprot:6468321-Amphidinium_carterae.1